MLRCFLLLAAALLTTVTAYAQPTGPHRVGPRLAKGTAVVAFRLAVAGAGAPVTIGLRGSAAPLSWERTTPLTDADHDGVYEVVLAFAPPLGSAALEFKYVRDSALTTTWESTGNRQLVLEPGPSTLPTQRWNDGPPDPAQVAAAALREEIAALDAAMFAAYNARDLDKLMSFFADDLEFYHDRGGLSGYAQNRQAFQETMARPEAPHRELIAGSLEVYPVPGYGAIATGLHRFCHDEHGRPDCGTFKFLNVWRKQPDGGWKISRLVSYDH